MEYVGRYRAWDRRRKAAGLQGSCWPDRVLSWAVVNSGFVQESTVDWKRGEDGFCCPGVDSCGTKVEWNLSPQHCGKLRKENQNFEPSLETS